MSFNDLDPTSRRFYLQSVARSLVPPNRRLRRCLRSMARGADAVEIRTGNALAWFYGLQTCASVWNCPICAAKIAEYRARELNTAVGRWTAAGGVVAMSTYTLQHDRGAILHETMGILKDGTREFKSGRAYQKIMADFGLVHTVNATEITWGENGFHPHKHELLFFSDPTKAIISVDEDTVSFEAAARSRWMYMLERQNAGGIDDIAYNVRLSNQYVAEYVAKMGREPIGKHWSIGREMAKAILKKAGRGGLTPADLLLHAAAGNNRAAELWREYEAEMFGRTQLKWSPLLRAAVGMKKEKTDGEIAAADLTPSHAIFAAIERGTWWGIENLPVDIRAVLLNFAKAGDKAGFDAFMSAQHIGDLARGIDGDDASRGENAPA